MDRIPSRGFLHSLRDSPGKTSLSLSGGFFHCILEGLPEDGVGRLQGRWRIQESADGLQPDHPVREIRVQTVHSGIEQFLARPPVEQRPEEYRFEYATEAGEHLCWSYRFALQFDPAARSGKLALCRTDFPYLEEAVENTLRVLFSWQTVEAGGFLIHSAGVTRNGEGYLFFGPSGAGKTTISNLCRLEDVLHDDLCVVFPHQDHYVAIGFPFLGDDRKHLSMRQTMTPIAGFFRLIQSAEVAVEQLSRVRAAGELTGSLPFVTEHPETGAAALHNVARMVETVPVFRLSFRKDLSFWNEIDRERGRRDSGS